ncbi:MAG TPA: efflux transporter outer membrane subunit [Candidatus Limnocylindrales bacterium]|nr:efflux transporter outer membrane subunit [Candidatus Limnocylindrales bacterium]
MFSKRDAAGHAAPTAIANGEFFARPKERTLRSLRFQLRLSSAALILGAAFLAGCTVGPKYHTPTAETPAAYKEVTPDNMKEVDNWKMAQPSDTAIRGNWWELFNDPELNKLEEQVDGANQNIAASYNSFLAARAMVKEARAQYFPTVTTSPSINRQRQSANLRQFSGSGTGTGSTSSPTSTAFSDYDLPFDATWVPDLWGRVRNTVRSNVYNAQASAADFQNVRLTMHAEVASDYFQLRSQDALKQLLDSTVKAYEESVRLTRVLYETGIDSEEAVAQAETQLDTTRAEDTNLGIARAQFEHAIAVLVGQPPSTFSIPEQPLKFAPPPVPLSLPSQLLERRPDIAASERLAAQANAQIGIARAAYYPTVTLSASGGFESSAASDWFAWPSRFWSIGAAAAETIFDAGLRRATNQQYEAAYNQTVANYRQTVLTAFQQVEDDLASLRILSQQIDQQDAAVKAAQRNLDIATDRYKLGIDPYLNVITAQTTLLTNQQTAVNLRSQEMVSSVQLVEALGGGWDRTQLPSPASLVAASPSPGPGSPAAKPPSSTQPATTNQK